MCILLLLALVASVGAKSCPSVTTVDFFDFQSFTQGVWYEVARYANIYENNADCGSSEYTRKGDVVYVTNRGVVNHQTVSVHGTVKLASNNTESAILIYTFPYGAKRTPTDIFFNILALENNNNCLIGYYCKNEKSTQSYQEYAWILSRTKTLDAHCQVALDNYVQKTDVLDADKFYWPKFTPEACRAEQ